MSVRVFCLKYWEWIENIAFNRGLTNSRLGFNFNFIVPSVSTILQLLPILFSSFTPKSLVSVILYCILLLTFLILLPYFFLFLKNFLLFVFQFISFFELVFSSFFSFTIFSSSSSYFSRIPFPSASVPVQCGKSLG